MFENKCSRELGGALDSCRENKKKGRREDLKKLGGQHKEVAEKSKHTHLLCNFPKRAALMPSTKSKSTFFPPLHLRLGKKKGK